MRTIVISYLKHLFNWMSTRSFDANEFRPTQLRAGQDLDDPRTLAIPVGGGASALTYFDVSSMLVRERLALKRTIRSGWNFKLAEDLHSGSEKSPFGRWAEEVQADGRQDKIRKNLLLWHRAWYASAKEILAMVSEGKLEEAERKFNYGECALASKRVAVLLEQFWEYEAENAESARHLASR